jgi:hypothetical protein
LKNNYGVSWKAGICGGSVASAGNCFLINSNDFSSSNSKIQMFQSGQIQIGNEDLTVTPNTRLVIGDIFSSFMQEVKSVRYFEIR